MPSVEFTKKIYCTWGVVFSNKEEQNHLISGKLAINGGDCVGPNEADLEQQVLYVFSPKWNLWGRG